MVEVHEDDQLADSGNAIDRLVTQNMEQDAQSQEGDAWQKLRENLRAARETQGDFFAEYGEPDQPSEVLILIAPVEIPEDSALRQVPTRNDKTKVVISIDKHGIGASFVEDDDKVVRMITKRARANALGEAQPMPGRLMQGLVKLDEVEDIILPLAHSLDPNDPTSIPLVNNTISESIKRVDRSPSPYQRNYDYAIARTNMATTLMGTVDNLPPRG